MIATFNGTSVGSFLLKTTAEYRVGRLPLILKYYLFIFITILYFVIDYPNYMLQVSTWVYYQKN